MWMSGLLGVGQGSALLLSRGATYQRNQVGFKDRRNTVTCLVGGVPVGSGHPIVVQSMTNTDTADAESTAGQVAALARAGSALVRVTVNNEAAATAVPELIQRLADIGVSRPVLGA